MKTKLIQIMIIVIMLAGALVAGAGLRAIDAVKNIYPVVITHRTSGCLLDFNPYEEFWWVEDPTGAVIFEGGELAAVQVFLSGCP